MESLASRWTFINLLTLMLPFLPPSCFLCISQSTPALLSTCNASPAASPPGGSESGRSTPSLSTYSDGKSPSSTYVAAPRHFHIPGMPRLCRLGCDAPFVSSSRDVGWMSFLTRTGKLHCDGVASLFCSWFSHSKALEVLRIHAGKS